MAARAGVSKVTIYKWWPSRGSVAVDAYFHRYRQTSEFVDTGDLEADLTGQIRLLIDAFRGRAGTVMAELIGQAQSDPALAATLRSHWLEPAPPGHGRGAPAGRRAAARSGPTPTSTS